MKTPLLSGSLVELRRIERRDLETLYGLMQREVFREGFFQTRSELVAEFDRDGFWSDQRGRLIISPKGKKDILGQISFFKDSGYKDGYEVGYVIYEKSNRGKGYATDALKLLVDYLFDTRDINRLELSIRTINPASRRVAQKSGFIHEGCSRGVILIEGQYYDMDIFSIIRADREN